MILFQLIKLLKDNNIHLIENHTYNQLGTSVGFAGKI